MSEKTKAAGLGGWAGDLACPVCFGSLKFSEPEVICLGCGRSYPVVDGIPVLIAERATLQK